MPLSLCRVPSWPLTCSPVDVFSAQVAIKIIDKTQLNPTSLQKVGFPAITPRRAPLAFLVEVTQTQECEGGPEGAVSGKQLMERGLLMLFGRCWGLHGSETSAPNITSGLSFG